MKKKILALFSFNFNQVERMHNEGYVTSQVWESYRYVWKWSAPRFGGFPGWQHECFWKEHGREAYYAKINKVRKAFGFTPYPS